MVCSQIKHYAVFIVIQIFFQNITIGVSPLRLFSAIPFIAVLYLLCEYKYFETANIFVGAAVLIGIYADILMFMNRTKIKSLMKTNQHL